jgi:hypothetical protein
VEEVGGHLSQVISARCGQLEERIDALKTIHEQQLQDQTKAVVAATTAANTASAAAAAPKSAVGENEQHISALAVARAAVAGEQQQQQQQQQAEQHEHVLEMRLQLASAQQTLNAQASAHSAALEAADHLAQASTALARQQVSQLSAEVRAAREACCVASDRVTVDSATVKALLDQVMTLQNRQRRGHKHQTFDVSSSPANGKGP